MDTREKLIETTRELLWELGYVGMSPKDIQDKSGVGQGSMYHHFKGKADLVLESIRKNAGEMREISAERLAQGGSALEKIRTFLTRPRNIQRGCRIGGLTRDPYIIAEPAMRQILQDSFDWLNNALAGIIKEGQATGELDSALDAGDTASAISASLQGAYVLARASGTDEPFYSAVRGMLGLLEKIAKN